MPDKPLEIRNISEELCKNLEFVFTDIDDTVTTDGIISAYAFNAIWELYKNGIKVIPVTGRPAGWCDHIARMWPVYAVIGENGAFYFMYNRSERKMKRRFFLEESEREENGKKLISLGERIVREVPGSRIAADQPFRFSDLAIDYSEDTGPLGKEEVSKICSIMKAAGAKCKVSSIHVNCWYGNYDKLECLKRFLKENSGKDLGYFQERILFIGDSPNDEPMFKELQNTIAVSNINNFMEDLKYYPKYITTRPSGEGFQEAVEMILARRRRS